MEDVTPMDAQNTAEMPPNFDTIKSILVAMNTIFLIVTLWVLSSMVLHGKMEGKWDLKTVGGRMYIACFVSILVALPKLILFYVQVNVTSLPDWENKCETLNDLNAIFSSFLLFSPYYFLWYRQKVLTCHPILQASHSKIMQVLSWGYFVYITLVFVVVPCAGALPVSTVPKNGDCFDLPRSDDPAAMVVSNFAIASIVFMEISLLGLFIYPMIKVKLALRGIADHSNNDNHDVENTIRRTTISAFLTCAVHIAGHTLSKIHPAEHPNVVNGVYFHVAAFIAMFCLLATFGDFVKILTVFCSRCKKTNQSADQPITYRRTKEVSIF